MYRCSSGALLVLTIAFASILTGCLGSSTPNPASGGVKAVSISPAGFISMEVGSTQAFTASATDANGKSVPGVNVNYVVSVPVGQTGSAPLSVTSTGAACAGSWDQTLSLCSAGTPGIAIVSAVVNGFSSPQTTVYVHYHIDSLKVVPAQTIPPPYDCFSQGKTWVYQGVAYNNGVDITTSVGPMSWSTTPSGVLTTATYTTLPALLPYPNQVQITAESPGITQLIASVSGTNSTPVTLTTCLVQYVRVQLQGTNVNSTNVITGSTVSIEATAVDTLNNVVSKPPLTWATSNPQVVSISSLTNTTGFNTATARVNLGGGDVTASCTPPSCNIGVMPGLPIYASDGPVSPYNSEPGFNSVSIDVTSTKSVPTYSAWAATNQCGNVSGCTSTMFQITPGATTNTNPISATVTLPRTPNSMMFNFQTSPRMYLGSNLGLMFMDSGSSPKISTVSSATTPCNVILCGTVLTISNDGKQVVVSDNVSTTPQVYLYNSATSAVTDLVLPGVATAAAFSPDQSKIFLVTEGGSLYVYSTVDALTPTSIAATANTVAFSANGSFAYVGGTPSASSISGFGACTTPASEVFSTPITTSATPLAIYPSPAFLNGTSDQVITVLDPPFVETYGITVSQPPLTDGEFVCTPPTVNAFTISSVNLGQGDFIPLYANLVANGTEMLIVTQTIPAVLEFNISSNTLTSTPLFNSAQPLAASSTTDGSQVYVASCDQFESDGVTCAVGTVHIVEVNGRGDYQQVPYINNTTNNMCNGQGAGAPLCIPQMVAVQPK